VAAELLARYDFIAVPVLDANGGMVGIVTHDDVIDVLREEATEDLQRQAGVSPIGEEYLQASFLKMWRSRAFWLSLLFVAELGTFTVMSYFEDALAAVVVLSLFVPLCISTGGNSGSQAATLVTRALALGQISPRDWAKVFRRELVMGLALGLTLGAVAFVRGALTPADTRSGPRKVAESFAATVPLDRPLLQSRIDNDDDRIEYYVPASSTLTRTLERGQRVRLPVGADSASITPNGNSVNYQFPPGSEVRTDPVSPWALAQVIAFSVLGICLWGTLIGSMLPLFFKARGIDPGLASSPFVATAVDVTGIAIFFIIASKYLL
jgi:magnesium transporter